MGDPVIGFRPVKGKEEGMWGRVWDLEDSVDVENCVRYVSVCHEPSLVRVDKRGRKVDILEFLGHNGREKFKVCV